MKTANPMWPRTRTVPPVKWTLSMVPLLVLMPALLPAASCIHADVTPAAAVAAPQVGAATGPDPAKSPSMPPAEKTAVPSGRESAAMPSEPTATPESELSEKWGVQVVSLRLTAGGYMLDFRYRVLDAEKSAKLADPHLRPYVIDEATGAKFLVPSPPKIGQLRNTRHSDPDKNYFVLFANPGNYIKSGGKVSVVIGDLKLEHLTVE